jgi:hypothetical protein
MIQILLALISSLGGSLGGRIGDLITQLVATIGTVQIDKAQFDAFAGPWIIWANGIVDAGRDPTQAEHAAARALADAVNANIESLGSGGPALPLPSPPA